MNNFFNDYHEHFMNKSVYLKINELNKMKCQIENSKLYSKFGYIKPIGKKRGK